jgi:hypothetical protein
VEAAFAGLGLVEAPLRVCLSVLDFDLVEVFGEPVEYPDEVREGVPPVVAR